MKWVLRIGIGLVSVIVIAAAVLFIMGKREGAGRFRASLEVNATPAQIWPWLNEPERLKQWVSWLVEVRQPDGVRAVGARHVWVMRDENNGGQLMEIRSTCTEYAPPERMTVTLAAMEGFDGEQKYRLTPLPDGRTRVEIESQFRLTLWFAALMEPVITPSARHKLEGDVARLKTLVEKDRAVTASR